MFQDCRTSSLQFLRKIEKKKIFKFGDGFVTKCKLNPTVFFILISRRDTCRKVKSEAFREVGAPFELRIVERKEECCNHYGNITA